MRYFGWPKWRYLLFPVAIFSMLPLGILTFLTIGMFEGTKFWFFFMNWCTYEEDKYP